VAGTQRPRPAAHVAIALVDPAARDRLGAALERRGHAVHTFEETADLLPALMARPVDVVVAPLDGPRLAGPTLCHVLRQRFGATAPLVVLVGPEGADEARVERAVEAADDCVLDPSPELLANKVGVLLHRRAAEGARPASQPIAPDPRVPCRLGAYDLLSVLGRGCHGTVYEGRRVEDGRPVALKLLSREVSESAELAGRFLREVRALAEVSSPHVVQVHEAGCERGRFFVAMERVHGRPATALIEEGPVDPGVVLEIARGVCAALVALHARGLVHRDVKPGNILVDAAGKATLIDLGLAKHREDRSVTGEQFVLGTLAYMAPEVAQGRAADIGSDLYGLGVTLWELLTGSRPHDAPTPTRLLQLVASGRRAPDVRDVRPDVPGPVAWFVARLLHPSPARRLRDPAGARAAAGIIARAVGAWRDGRAGARSA